MLSLSARCRIDGTYPLATTRWEKSNIGQKFLFGTRIFVFSAENVPWFVRMHVFASRPMIRNFLKNAPKTFKHMDMIGKDFPEDTAYTIQVAPEDCTGCSSMP